MEVVTTEILSDLPGFETVYPVEAIFDIGPKSELEKLKVIVYSRKE